MNSFDSIDLLPLESRHRDATLRWMNDPEMMLLLNRMHVITPNEHETWFAALPARRELDYFAIEAGKPRSHVGNIWLHGIDRSHHKAEVRIVLALGMHNRGIGRTAISILSHKALGEMGLHRLYAYVLTTNTRARRAFEQAGFTLEGTLRSDRWTGAAYADVWVFGRVAPA